MDRSDSNLNCRDRTDQWCIQERSVRLAALIVEYRHYANMIPSDSFHEVWDSRLEINPMAQETPMPDAKYPEHE